jgi:hypothetical protein
VSAFTESVVDQAALAWLESVGWQVRNGADAGLVKLNNPESGSKRYARYLPFWA